MDNRLREVGFNFCFVFQMRDLLLNKISLGFSQASMDW